MKKTAVAAAVASLFALPTFAEDVGSGVDLSANVGVSTDYIWRGVSQTGGHPAISGGFDLSHSTGLYVGNWNSNVDFGDDTSLEMDFYGGFKNQLFSSGINYDVGAIGYVYPGEDDLDFYELYAGLSATVDVLTPGIKAYYDPDNSNYYVDMVVALALPAEFTVKGHYGIGLPNEGDAINDFLVGISRPFFGVDLGLAYTDSEIDSDHVVLTVSKAF